MGCHANEAARRTQRSPTAGEPSKPKSKRTYPDSARQLQCSYSIYLWHTFIGRAVEINSKTLGAFWLYVGLCIGIGIVLSKVVEQPYLALREKWFSTEKLASPAKP